ncbi:MAG TPA: 3'-5' exonuclease, partial [Geminicoccaceae bacterium]|nr:3'-5' exonuclease [Geminicoccaceae bacterium]
MLERLKRAWYRRRLRDPGYGFLLDEQGEGGDELVSIDCETTGLDAKTDQILSVGAIKIKGDAILTSQRLDFLVRPKAPVSDRTVLIHHIRPVDLEGAVPVDEAIRRVLEFVGPRPLVGYFLEFDVAMLNRHVRPLIGIPLPNRQIEVSRLYYDWRAAQVPPGGNIDLRFETIRERLDLPRRAAHDAFNDALL